MSSVPPWGWCVGAMSGLVIWISKSRVSSRATVHRALALASAVALVEQLDRMDGTLPAASADEPGTDLHHAAGIACDHQVRICRRDVRELALQHHVRCVRLDEIVDASAATAHLALRERHQLELRNRTKH